MRRRLVAKSFTVAALLSIMGCSQAVRKPQLFHPGPAPFQQANAEVIDPYPMPDMGPEIVGGRPREFGTPRNEVERAQQYMRSRGIMPAADAAPVAVGPPVPLMQAAPRY